MAVLEGMFVVSMYFFGIVVALCLAVVCIYATVDAIRRNEEKYQKETDIEESDDWFQ